jgi:hypothetical protein
MGLLRREHACRTRVFTLGSRAPATEQPILGIDRSSIRRSGRAIFCREIPVENPRRAGTHLTSIRVIGAAFGSDPNRSSREVTCLPIAQIIRGRMIIFVSVIGALVVASTVFALLIPSGAKVTLSDIAQEMDNLHRSQSDRPPLT